MLRATIGGLGLTGVIAWADIQLKRVAGPWIDAETVPFQSLSAFLDLSRESNDRFEYTRGVARLFCRQESCAAFSSVATMLRSAGKEFHPKRGPKLPFALPAWMLNRYSVKAFNTVYYKIHSAKERYERHSLRFVFLPARFRPAMEPALWQARFSAVSVRDSGNESRRF